jgi:hypothetical protein
MYSGFGLPAACLPKFDRSVGVAPDAPARLGAGLVVVGGVVGCCRGHHQPFLTMFGRVGMYVVGLALVRGSVAMNEEEGPAFFDAYKADITKSLGGIYAYTVEPAESCGITMVNYGSRLILDLAVTELKRNGDEDVRAPLVRCGNSAR